MCRVIQNELFTGAAKDGIPAIQLMDSDLVGPGSVWLDFLNPTDRVIGLEVDGEYLAVPLNILWWHEILNLNDHDLAITYCPLTGSSMVFERAAAGGAEFGTSGLLHKNNLVMYDRTGGDEENSLWPQMLAGGFCGPSEGEKLTMVAAIEIEWEDWLALHPDTRVVGSQTGVSRDYTVYPYGSYEVEDNEFTLIPVTNPDGRRPPKERILGIPFVGGQGGIAFPFGALRDAAVGDLAVVHTILSPGGGHPVVVFWDGGAAAAMAFTPATATRDLNFEVRNGAFVDVETRTQWSVEGKGLSGPLAGEQLQTIEGFVSFWFAFSQFFPNRFIADFYSRRQATVEQQWTRSLRFLSTELANAAFTRDGAEVAAMAAGTADTELQVEQVVLRIHPAPEAPHGATADFDLVHLRQGQETLRERWSITLRFTFLTVIPSELVVYNPMGILITYLQADRALVTEQPR